MMAYPARRDYDSCTCTATCGFSCGFSCHDCSFNQRRSDTSHSIIITNTRLMYKSDEELEAFIKSLKRQNNYVRSMCAVQVIKEIHNKQQVKPVVQSPRRFYFKGARI